ncbi:MAG: 1-acyl-sn-glycerol-3-phosphate acyltransferase [Spirosomaceae bacterium]|nr:1-acyl-sn-glycerol-3-phosphate acyltransferase [Spirosomataceae bacterium]MDP5138990.1 1-acyl-sn-glycerol-3-phosphate acyltransferase [Spirosomataceae bacterium]
MKKIIDYILGAIYMLYFGICLCIFHVVQVIAFNVFGRKAHQNSVNALNACLCYGWLLTGSTINRKKMHDIPENRAIIFVANHQSTFDIPGMIWLLRKYTPLFVSKKELGKGIPSISYNLRVGGAALIDRKDRTQALKEIIRLGKYASENKFAVAIFPEGTRSRTTNLKTFATGGISTLTRVMPNSIIVPVAIENTGKFNPTGFFPLTSFTKMTWTTLAPIEPNGKTPEEIAKLCESAIRQVVEK